MESQTPAYFPGTGHWYELIPSTTCWTQARDSATARGGYLSTVLSGAENDFIVAEVLPSDFIAWLGGYEPNNDGDWLWYTGEVWSYTNWQPGEPNNATGPENRLQIVTQPGWEGRWNDGVDCHPVMGFVVEYDCLSSTVFGPALQFDGVDDYVEVPHSAALNPSPQLTVEARIVLDSLPERNGYVIVSKWRSSWNPNGSYHFWVAGSTHPDSLKLVFHTESGYCFSGKTLSPCRTYHVAASADGSNIRLYIDGVLDGTVAAGPAPMNSDRVLLIGRNSHGLIDPLLSDHFPGRIDEVRISNIARDPSEFCMTGECTPDGSTIGLWHFDEASGDVAVDATGAHNGAIYGASRVDNCFCCNSPCHGDPVCDSVTNVQDVVETINVAFRGSPPMCDVGCPASRTDVNCDGVSTIQDVVKMVNVAFRGADPATEFCAPCLTSPPLPRECP
ncbi:MAG: LamG-like jellyroll fold domain-containing protein [Candidatus Zixiibacteriota bacterium]